MIFPSRFRALLVCLVLGIGFGANYAQTVLQVKHGSTNIPQGSTFEFGNTAISMNLTRTFSVTNISSSTVTVGTISISSNINDPGYFSAEKIQIGALQPGQSGTFDLVFHADGAGTVHRDIRLFVGGTANFTFGGRATANAPDLRVALNGTNIGSASTVDLGSTSYNQPLRKTFTLFNDGNVQLTISNLAWDGTEITQISAPPAIIQAGGSATFTLDFGASQSGTITREIRLTTNDPSPNPFRFNARWTVGNAIGPVIRLKQENNIISPGQTVFFGNTGISMPINKTFTAENLGDQPLTIAPISISSHVNDPSHFKVAQNNVINVPPGGSASFTLSFDAAGLGTVSSEIRLFVGGTSRFSFFAKGTVLSPDYSISITPASRMINPGQSAVYVVSVEPLFGFSQTVSMSISGLPTGAAGSFNPVSIPAGSNSSLRINTTSGVVIGRHTFTVTGVQGSISRTTTAVLNINEPSDFSIAVNPTQRIVSQGNETTFRVSLSAISGFTGSVALSLMGMPSNTTFSFSPTSLTPGQTSTLTINTTSQTPTGDHQLTIKGINGGRSRTVEATLTVNASSGELPLVESIAPNHISGGQQTVVTLQGQHFKGGTVSIATQLAEPGDPVPSAFPNVSVVSIAPDGRSMQVNVDARNAQVSGFYTLIVDNGTGQAGAVFRVVTNGPQVDAWTPAEPTNCSLWVSTCAELQCSVTAQHIFAAQNRINAYSPTVSNRIQLQVVS